MKLFLVSALKIKVSNQEDGTHIDTNNEAKLTLAASKAEAIGEYAFLKKWKNANVSAVEVTADDLRHYLSVIE